jgi:dTDP-3,4-didehydro-2,6-dideoxy-alpha-D-glucose 3-reductase
LELIHECYLCKNNVTIYAVAVWGLGNHAKKRILPILAAMDEVNLLGVCSRNGDTVTEVAEDWGCLGWYSPEEMLSHLVLDIVYIATPIGLHFSMAMQALKAGKHVWCEKPLTCDFRETQALVTLAKRNGKVLTESFMYLHHSQFLRVKQFIDESKQVHSVICRFGIPALENPGFRNEPKLCGGALWDVASYTVSAILVLFPNQKVDILFSEVQQKEDSPVDTEGRVLLRFSRGATAYLEWGVGVAYKNELDVWADNGSLFTDKIFSKPKDYKPKYYMRDLNGNVSVEHGEQSEQFVQMFHDFVQLIGDEQKIVAEREAILGRAKLMNDIVNFKL